MSSGRRLLLVSSSGGTLLELLALEPWWSRHDVAWAAVRAADTESVLAGRRVHWVSERRAGRPLGLLPATVEALRVLRAERPDVVVSAGAGVAVGFFAAARLLGAARLWLPTQNLVQRVGWSDRICSALASAVVLQRASARRGGRREHVVGELY